jgi:serine/threonine protein phosphatase PrpC
MTMTKFNLVVNIEVAEDKGEDANLAEDFGPTFLMGVFDGLGGRSAGYGYQTGGRIASEEACKISKIFFKQWNSQITSENVLQLQQQICQSLKVKADIYIPKTSSRLKGSLMEHRLCTTLALARILKQQTQEKIFEADVAWMGDSRIYFLSPTKGLQQLTKDDIVTPKDALEMLRQDPPMSQYLTADINPRWQIRFQHYRFEEMGCFLACTDGCFQYVSAPWEFEKLLLETLSQSEGEKMDNNNWKKLIEQKYIEIKQDDVSLILYPVGFNGIKHLKNAYQARLQYLQDNFIYLTANTRYDDLQNLWQKYRIDYEHYLPLIQDIQPSLPSVQSTQQTATDLSPVVANSSSVTSGSSSLSTNMFQGLTQVFKHKVTAKAEEIKKLLDQAYSYYENDQLREAQDLCNQVLKLDEHHNECKYLLGLIYTKLAFCETNYSQKTKLFQQAVKYFREVINNPGGKLIESHQTLGFIYYQLNEWEKAVFYYKECFKSKDAPKVEGWEEHLEAFVISFQLISYNHEAFNIAIQFCQNLATVLAYGKNAYPYYFMAVLQEIKGELNLAWNSIQTAMSIYNSSYSSGVKYESVQKARQKYQEIQIKLNNYREYY